MAFARWGGASWEQDLSWGHRETLIRPGCLRSSSALLHLSPKTRGGGRLLCWPPRQSAHLGCSAASARLCCQVGLSFSTALQTSVTSLQDALQCTACLHWLSLGTKIEKEQFGFLSPIPRELHKRPATPKSAVRQGHHVRAADVGQDGCGNGQDILQCPRHWQKAELETTGEAQGSWQPAVGPSRVQCLQKCLAP